ncbi:hypothetical protein [Nitratifractor sp.]
MSDNTDRKKEGSILGAVIASVVGIFAVYYAIAATIFEIRNPTANRMQPLMHPISVLKFEKLPQFQVDSNTTKK